MRRGAALGVPPENGEIFAHSIGGGLQAGVSSGRNATLTPLTETSKDLDDPRLIKIRKEWELALLDNDSVDHLNEECLDRAIDIGGVREVVGELPDLSSIHHRPDINPSFPQELFFPSQDIGGRRQ